MENSSSKQDVIEILHVMVLTKARLESAPTNLISLESETGGGEDLKKRRAAKRAAERGNDFFNVRNFSLFHPILYFILLTFGTSIFDYYFGRLFFCIYETTLTIYFYICNFWLLENVWFLV